MKPPIEFQSVTMRYGSRAILPNLSFELAPESITVLLGPNGAGKTTSLLLALGLIKPSAGTVRVFGHAAGSMHARQITGFAPQELDFPLHLQTKEVLQFKLALTQTDQQGLTQLIDRFELGSFLTTPAGRLSGGQKRRLSLALALAGNPQLVILDEPTTGLDIESRLRLWAEIERLRSSGSTVLLTTHDIDDLAQLECRGLMLVGGAIQFDGSLSRLLQQVNVKKLHFSILGSHESDFRNWFENRYKRTLAESKEHTEPTARASDQPLIRSLGSTVRVTMSTRSAELTLKDLMETSFFNFKDSDLLIERNQWDRLKALKGESHVESSAT